MCNDCIKSGNYSERNCIKCNKRFTAEKDYQHYCSIACSCSKIHSEGTRTKIRKSLLKKNENNPKKNKVIKFEKMTFEKLYEIFENKGCKLW